MLLADPNAFTATSAATNAFDDGDMDDDDDALALLSSIKQPVAAAGESVAVDNTSGSSHTVASAVVSSLVELCVDQVAKGGDEVWQEPKVLAERR